MQEKSCGKTSKQKKERNPSKEHGGRKFSGEVHAMEEAYPLGAVSEQHGGEKAGNLESMERDRPLRAVSEKRG